MGGTTTPAPGGIDLHAEVPLSDLKMDTTPEQTELQRRAFLSSPEYAKGLAEDTAELASILRDTGKDDTESDLPTGTIDFATFLKADLRTGTVTKAEWVPKSDKLLRLEVSFGSEIGTRVILAGIAKDFTVEGLPGTQIVAVVNLAPRKMMGQESHGMLLAARAENGNLCLTQCPGVPDGSKLG